MITAVLRKIFRTNLGVKKSERCLIFADRIMPGEDLPDSERERRSRLGCIVLLASEVGRGFAKEVIVHEYPATGSHGAEPPSDLWEIAFGKRVVRSLARKRLLGPLLTKTAVGDEVDSAAKVIASFKDDAVDVVVALSNFSTSHTLFRDFLTRLCGCRYASMPIFDMSMLEGPMNVDWKDLAQRTRHIAGMLTRAEGVEISAPNGTSLSFSVKGRKGIADTGILTRPGSFGNLPAGEAFLAPCEGTANGRLVLEWAHTGALKSPVTLSIKSGNVADISGGDGFAAILGKILDERSENRNIAEFGIGTNVMARRPDNILEAEKIMGTIHIAFGDNSTFGGTVKTPFHQDFVFFRPTVTLIGSDGGKTVLMRKGKIV